MNGRYREWKLDMSFPNGIDIEIRNRTFFPDRSHN